MSEKNFLIKIIEKEYQFLLGKIYILSLALFNLMAVSNQTCRILTRGWKPSYFSKISKKSSIFFQNLLLLN
jgi:uncharacterized Fe-S cluster-containing radical SAM superfamily protein